MRVFESMTPSRYVPAAAVTLLLCLAAAAPSPRNAGVAPPPQLQSPCSEFAIDVAGDSTLDLLSANGVEQALPAQTSVAACSLRAIITHPSYGSMGTLELRDWDPTTLAPVPDAIALRREFFSMSDTWYNGGRLPRFAFVPPVVTSSVPGVAEPPNPEVALQLFTAHGFSGPTELSVFFTPEGPAELPAAVKLGADGSREPLPGPHPVLAHTVCTGDDDLGSLRVVQAVTRADVKPFPSPREFAQRFRVPQQVELRWVELAMGGVSFTGTYDNPGIRQFPVLAVVDGEQLPAPVPGMPPPLVEALVNQSDLSISSFSGPVWGSHVDFDHTVTLEPDHDYWLYVREAATSRFFDRRIRGDEPAVFTASIGPFFARADSLGEWTQAADQVLAFRIVGKPTGQLAPPAPPPIPRPTPSPAPPVPGASAFALNTTPNPAPGPVRVSWSGAVAPVRFEVMDARGRRVADGLGGAAGAWTWAGIDREGRAVASGVYFVRARDSAGQSGTERVTIVR
jgi:hypothetical protein